MNTSVRICEEMGLQFSQCINLHAPLPVHFLPPNKQWFAQTLHWYQYHVCPISMQWNLSNYQNVQFLTSCTQSKKIRATSPLKLYFSNIFNWISPNLLTVFLTTCLRYFQLFWISGLMGRPRPGHAISHSQKGKTWVKKGKRLSLRISKVCTFLGWRFFWSSCKA